MKFFNWKKNQPTIFIDKMFLEISLAKGGAFIIKGTPTHFHTQAKYNLAHNQLYLSP